MTRKRFERIDVDLNQLMLDKKKARIRHGVDQADCIARILKKEVQVLNLIKDLASKGLSTTSLLVSPGDQPETWVVRDGNRRVTAMKLYTRPDLAPTPDIVAKIQAIKRRFPDAEFEPLEVLSSTDEAAIRQEILSRHNGERDGAGLVTWSTYLRTLSLIEAGETAEYRVPLLYVTWAEAQSVYVDDDFPLSTLQRFFRTEHLAALGVRVDGDKIQPVSDETKALAMAQRVIGDFQPGAASALTVNEVFTDAQAKAYIDRVRSTVRLPPFAAEAPPPKGGGKTAGAGTQGRDKAASPAPNPADGGTAGGGGPDAQEPSPPTSGRARPSPQKDPLDRNKVFGRGSPDLPIPEKETNDLVFPGERNHEKPMSNNTILKALDRMGYKHRMTGHGFRGIASTILHELGHRHDVIELQLAHQERNAVSAAYNHATYLKERRVLMQAWADHLDELRRGAKVLCPPQSGARERVMSLGLLGRC